MRRLAFVVVVVSTATGPAWADPPPVVGPIGRPKLLTLGGSPRLEPDGLGTVKAPAPTSSTVKLQIPVNNGSDVPLSGTLALVHGGATHSQPVTVAPSSIAYVTFLVAPFGATLPSASGCLSKPPPMQVTLSAQPARGLAFDAACTYKTSIDNPLWKASPDTAENWTKDRAFLKTVSFNAPASCNDPFSIVASVTNATKTAGKDLFVGVSPVVVAPPSPAGPVSVSKGVAGAPFSVAASATKPNIAVGLHVDGETETFDVKLNDPQGSLGGKVFNAGIKATATRTCVFTPSWAP